jgi:hypothetical protein
MVRKLHHELRQNYVPPNVPVIVPGGRLARGFFFKCEGVQRREMNDLWLGWTVRRVNLARAANGGEGKHV